MISTVFSLLTSATVHTYPEMIVQGILTGGTPELYSLKSVENASSRSFLLPRFNLMGKIEYAGNKWETREGEMRLLDEDFGGCIIRRVEEADTEQSVPAVAYKVEQPRHTGTTHPRTYQADKF